MTARRSVGIIEGGKQSAGRRIVGAALDAQGPLPHSREEPGRAESLGNVSLQRKPAEPGLGQDHRIECSPERLAQSGLHVPPNADDFQVGPRKQHLRLAAERAGTDCGPAGQVVEGSVSRGDQRIGQLLTQAGPAPSTSASGPLVGRSFRL